MGMGPGMGGGMNPGMGGNPQMGMGAGMPLAHAMGGGPGMDMGGGGGMPAGSDRPMFPCVKLRGLPFDAREDEIPQFLVGGGGGRGLGLAEMDLCAVFQFEACHVLQVCCSHKCLHA